MSRVTNADILKRCIDIEPSEKIKKIKDWKLIENETMILESVNLDRLNEEQLYDRAPYADIRCFLHQDEDEADYRFVGARDIFVALFAEDDNRPAIYQFSNLLNAVNFVNDVEKRFMFWRDRYGAIGKSIIEQSHEAKADRLKRKSIHSQTLEEESVDD